MMFLPGEMASELVNGLPAKFRSEPQHWYRDDPTLSTRTAPALTTPGFVRQRMQDKYEWTIGLGGDELGYVMPDRQLPREVRRRRVPAGHVRAAVRVGTRSSIRTRSRARRARRSRRTRPRSTARTGSPRSPISASCKYGQALGQANGHYEETNSAGWDLATDILGAVAVLTHNNDPTQVNPDFPGWWPEYLPPGNLP